MTRSRTWKSVILLAVGLSGQAGALTLEEAVASAVDSSPELRERYASYQSMLDEQDVVSSGYFPQVSVRGGIGPEHTNYSSGQEIDETLTRQDASLRVSQLLFNGFETSANTERLGHEAEAERLQLLAQAEDLALSVSQTYLDVRQAEELLALSERHVEGHLEVLNDVRNLAERGYANEADIAQVSARLANARASLVSARNNYLDTQARFLRLVNRPPGELRDPVTDESLLPQSELQAIDWARETHPQLQAAFSDIKAARSEVEASQSGYFPELSLEGYASTGEDIGGFEGKDEDYGVRLVLEYDLFNGGRDRARKSASNWRYNQALSIRERTEQELVEGTRLSWNAYRALEEQEELLRQSVDASTLAETAYLTQFRLGERSLLDLLNAKTEVYIARKNYLAARYDEIQARYRVLNATGRLGYALRVSYPDQWQGETKEDSK